MILTTDLEEFGYWWLPEKPDNKIPGIIKCTKRGRVELEINGAFSGLLIDVDTNFPIILGMTRKGEAVTLLRCFVINQNLTSPGMQTLQIFAHFLLVGMHVDSLEDLQFSRATFRLQGLDKWVGLSGIDTDYDFKKKSTTINFTPPAPVEAVLSDGITISIRFSWHGPNLVKGVSSATIRQKTHLRLEFEKLIRYEDILKVIGKVNNLLCLAIDEPVGLTEVQLATFELKRQVANEEYLEDIAIYFQSLPEGSERLKINEHNMLFRYKDIQDCFGEVINRWLEHYEKLEPAFNLYFSLVKKEDLFLENRFLSMIQGLETLHRRTGKNTSISEIDHNKRIQCILELVPGEYQEWLSQKLTYSNEPSLRTRLKELVKPFSDLYGNRKKREAFVNDVVNTRNYLTHFDERLVGKAVSGVDLVPLIQKLRTLFVLHFLLFIGFDQTSIRGVFQTSQKLNFNQNTQPRIILKQEQETG